MRRQIVDFSHPEPTKVEFIELAGPRETGQANAHALSRFLTATPRAEFSNNTSFGLDMLCCYQKANRLPKSDPFHYL